MRMKIIAAALAATGILAACDTASPSTVLDEFPGA